MFHSSCQLFHIRPHSGAILMKVDAKNLPPPLCWTGTPLGRWVINIKHLGVWRFSVTQISYSLILNLCHWGLSGHSLCCCMWVCACFNVHVDRFFCLPDSALQWVAGGDCMTCELPSITTTSSTTLLFLSHGHTLPSLSTLFILFSLFIPFLPLMSEMFPFHLMGTTHGRVAQMVGIHGPSARQRKLYSASPKQEWLLLNECAATWHEGLHKTTCSIEVVKSFRCHFICMLQLYALQHSLGLTQMINKHISKSLLYSFVQTVISTEHKARTKRSDI